MKNIQLELYKGNINKNIISVFIPVFLGNLINILYYLFDTIWIGRLVGQDAIAIITIVYPIVILFSAVAFGIGSTITIFVAKAYGANDNEEVKRIIKVSLIISSVFGAVFIILMEIMSGKILTLFNTPEEIFDDTKKYLCITLFSFIPVNLYFCISGILRGFGNTFITMVLLVVSTVINIILDPIMISGFGVFTELGVNGAAYATLISQFFVTAVLVFACMIKKDKFNWFNAKAEWRLYRDIILKSLMSIGQQILPAVSLLYITCIINRFGVEAVTAFGVIGKLDSIVLLAASSMSVTITTAFGQCYGAKENVKAMKYLICGIIYSLIITVAFQLAIAGMMGKMSGLFHVNNEVVAEVGKYFRYLALGYIFSDIACCIVAGINGSGDIGKATVVMMIGFLLVRITLSTVLGMYYSLSGIWFSITMSYLVMLISSAFLIRNEVKAVFGKRTTNTA